MSTLLVRLAEGSNGERRIPVPEGVEAAEYLNAFLKRRSPFDGDWVELAGGEYVRYGFIVSVRIGLSTSGIPSGPPRRG